MKNGLTVIDEEHSKKRYLGAFGKTNDQLIKNMLNKKREVKTSRKLLQTQQRQLN